MERRHRRAVRRSRAQERYLVGDATASSWHAAASGADENDEHRRSVAELCHDLRHPAAAIDALVSAVRIECELPAEAHARLGQIAAEARSIAALCRQVVSQDTGADAPLLRVDDVIREVARAAKATHPGIEVATVPVVAAIERASVRRILWNLLDNAMRAAGPDGDILVAVWTTDRHVRLEVGDSGPGFGQGAIGVAGLGLSIVQGTARRFGGEIEIGESSLGGALVAVLLPPPKVDLAEVPGRRNVGHRIP